MHAVTLSSFGGPEVLRWTEVPDPGAPGEGEVLLEVVASAVNRADLLQRQGPLPAAAGRLGHPRPGVQRPDRGTRTGGRGVLDWSGGVRAAGRWRIRVGRPG